METYDITNDSVIKEMPSVLTIEDLALILSISKSTVYRLVTSKQIRTIKVGRTMRITKDSVIRYLNTSMSA